MAKVFISFSTKDSEVASELKRNLELHSIACWKAPESILPGQTWEESIVDAIAQTDLMVLVWSGASQISEQVKRELTLACNQGKVIVPYRIEDISPAGTFAYYLSNTHWLDASSPSSCDAAVAIIARILDESANHPGDKAISSLDGAVDLDKIIEQIASCSGKLEAYIDPGQIHPSFQLETTCDGINMLLRQLNKDPLVILKGENPLCAIRITSADPLNKVCALLFAEGLLVVIREEDFSSVDLRSVPVCTGGTTTMAVLRIGTNNIVIDHKSMSCQPSDIDDISFLISFATSATALNKFKRLCGAGLYDIAIEGITDLLILDPLRRVSVDVAPLLESICLIKGGRCQEAFELLIDFRYYINDLDPGFFLVDAVDTLVKYAKGNSTLHSLDCS